MRRRRYVAAGATLAGLVALSVPFFQWQNKGLMVSRYDYAAAWVGPELDGARIIHLSDLHGYQFGAGQEKLISMVAGEEPDLIVITGDMVDRRRPEPGPALELARGLVGLAPVCYVTGNHEWALSPEIRQALLDGLEEAGVVLLDDRTVTLELGGSSLVLMGLSDRSLRAGEFAGQAETVTPDDPVLLLAHEPQFFEEYLATGATLVFSGHAHGGQVRLPWIGGLYAPGQGLFPALTAGLHTAGETTMVISRGLGNSGFPQRLFNRPEVVTLTLHAEDRQKGGAG